MVLEHQLKIQLSRNDPGEEFKVSRRFRRIFRYMQSDSIEFMDAPCVMCEVIIFGAVVSSVSSADEANVDARLLFCSVTVC